MESNLVGVSRTSTQVEQIPATGDATTERHGPTTNRDSEEASYLSCRHWSSHARPPYVEEESGGSDPVVDAYEFIERIDFNPLLRHARSLDCYFQIGNDGQICATPTQRPTEGAFVDNTGALVIPVVTGGGAVFHRFLFGFFSSRRKIKAGGVPLTEDLATPFVVTDEHGNLSLQIRGGSHPCVIVVGAAEERFRNLKVRVLHAKVGTSHGNLSGRPHATTTYVRNILDSGLRLVSDVPHIPSGFGLELDHGILEVCGETLAVPEAIAEASLQTRIRIPIPECRYRPQIINGRPSIARLAHSLAVLMTVFESFNMPDCVADEGDLHRIGTSKQPWTNFLPRGQVPSKSRGFVLLRLLWLWRERGTAASAMTPRIALPPTGGFDPDGTWNPARKVKPDGCRGAFLCRSRAELCHSINCMIAWHRQCRRYVLETAVMSTRHCGGSGTVKRVNFYGIGQPRVGDQGYYRDARSSGDMIVICKLMGKYVRSITEIPVSSDRPASNSTDLLRLVPGYASCHLRGPLFVGPIKFKKLEEAMDTLRLEPLSVLWNMVSVKELRDSAPLNNTDPLTPEGGGYCIPVGLPSSHRVLNRSYSQEYAGFFIAFQSAFKAQLHGSKMTEIMQLSSNFRSMSLAHQFAVFFFSVLARWGDCKCDKCGAPTLGEAGFHDCDPASETRCDLALRFDVRTSSVAYHGVSHTGVAARSVERGSERILDRVSFPKPQSRRQRRVYQMCLQPARGGKSYNFGRCECGRSHPAFQCFGERAADPACLTSRAYPEPIHSSVVVATEMVEPIPSKRNDPRVAHFLFDEVDEDVKVEDDDEDDDEEAGPVTATLDLIERKGEDGGEAPAASEATDTAPVSTAMLKSLRGISISPLNLLSARRVAGLRAPSDRYIEVIPDADDPNSDSDSDYDVSTPPPPDDAVPASGSASDAAARSASTGGHED